MSDRETRNTPSLPALQADNESRILFGYGAVFDQRSQDLGGFVEEIDRRAFNRTLATGNDILVTMDHDIRNLLGRTSSGTAKVYADDIGVRYEVDVPNTRAGDDALELVARGDVSGSSFTFRTTKNGDEWRSEDGKKVRRLVDVQLFELGPVAQPAYLDTDVAKRSLAESDIAEEEDNDTEGTQETTVSEARQLLRTIR